MKGIIITAGYGTRFLPASKTVPKEMFPMIDVPAIDFIIDEFIQSGIKDILLVTSRRKKTLEDYLDNEKELEAFFTAKNDNINLSKIKPFNANFYFVRQKEMLGTGHAILICKEFIGEDAFVIAYPDDVVFSNVPLAKQLIDVYNKTGESVLAVQEIEGDVSRYGVIDYKKTNDLISVKSIVEKPKTGTEPSHMISVGRYLFTNELMELLEKDFIKHTKGEFYHINAINKLAQSNKLFACKFTGDRIDIGDKLGYFEGIIKYALQREDIKEQAKNVLKKYV